MRKLCAFIVVLILISRPSFGAKFTLCDVELNVKLNKREKAWHFDVVVKNHSNSSILLPRAKACRFFANTCYLNIGERMIDFISPQILGHIFTPYLLKKNDSIIYEIPIDATQFKKSKTICLNFDFMDLDSSKHIIYIENESHQMRADQYFEFFKYIEIWLPIICL